MKCSKIIINILVILTIVSLPLSFSICAIVGEAEIFGVAGIIRYSWIMLLFSPIGFLTLLMGKWLKNTGKTHKIVAWICIPILLIFGSYKFIFNDISYDVHNVHIAAEKIDPELPNSIKVASHNHGGYSVSYVKITDDGEAISFAEDIRTNPHWMSELSVVVKSLLPDDIQLEMNNFDYFVLYDPSSGKYNVCPTTDESDCIFIAFDCELQRIIILDDL